MDKIIIEYELDGSKITKEFTGKNIRDLYEDVKIFVVQHNIDNAKMVDTRKE